MKEVIRREESAERLGGGEEMELGERVAGHVREIERDFQVFHQAGASKS